MDFPQQSQDYNRVTITCVGDDAIGELPSSFASSTVWPAANRAIFVPFLVFARLTLVKLVVFNGSVASGNVDVGVYDATGNLLVSSGSTAQVGTSAAQVFDVTDTVLLPGNYYFAVAMNGTTGTTSARTSAVVVQQGYGVLSQSAAFPLPSTATFAAAQDAYLPMVALTAQTVV